MKSRKFLLPVSIHLNLHCFHLISQFPILLNGLIITRHGDNVGLFTSRGVQRILGRKGHPLNSNHRFDPLSIILISSTISLTKMSLISPANTLPGLHSFCHLSNVCGHMIENVLSYLCLLRWTDKSISKCSSGQDGVIVDSAPKT